MTHTPRETDTRAKGDEQIGKMTERPNQREEVVDQMTEDVRDLLHRFAGQLQGTTSPVLGAQWQVPVSKFADLAGGTLIKLYSELKPALARMLQKKAELRYLEMNTVVSGDQVSAATLGRLFTYREEVANVAAKYNINIDPVDLLVLSIPLWCWTKPSPLADKDSGMLTLKLDVRPYLLRNYVGNTSVDYPSPAAAFIMQAVLNKRPDPSSLREAVVDHHFRVIKTTIEILLAFAKAIVLKGETPGPPPKESMGAETTTSSGTLPPDRAALAEELAGKYNKLEAEARDLHERLSNANEKNGQLTRQLQQIPELERENRTLRTRTAEYEQQLQAARVVQDAVQAQMRQLQLEMDRDRASYQEQLAKMSPDAKEATQLLMKFHDETKARLEKEINELNEGKTAAERKLAEAGERLTELRSQIDTLTTEKTNAETDLKASLETAQGLQQQIADLQAQKTAAEEAERVAETTLATAQKEKQGLQEQLTAETKKVSDAEAKVTAANGEVTKLREHVARQASTLSDLRDKVAVAIFQALNRDQKQLEAVEDKLAHALRTAQFDLQWWIRYALGLQNMVGKITGVDTDEKSFKQLPWEERVTLFDKTLKQKLAEKSPQQPPAPTAYPQLPREHAREVLSPAPPSSSSSASSVHASSVLSTPVKRPAAVVPPPAPAPSSSSAHTSASSASTGSGGAPAAPVVPLSPAPASTASSSSGHGIAPPVSSVKPIVSPTSSALTASSVPAMASSSAVPVSSAPATTSSSSAPVISGMATAASSSAPLSSSPAVTSSSASSASSSPAVTSSSSAPVSSSPAMASSSASSASSGAVGAGAGKSEEKKESKIERKDSKAPAPVESKESKAPAPVESKEVKDILEKLDAKFLKDRPTGTPKATVMEDILKKARANTITPWATLQLPYGLYCRFHDPEFINAFVMEEGKDDVWPNQLKDFKSFDELKLPADPTVFGLVIAAACVEVKDVKDGKEEKQVRRLLPDPYPKLEEFKLRPSGEAITTAINGLVFYLQHYRRIVMPATDEEKTHFAALPLDNKEHFTLAHLRAFGKWAYIAVFSVDCFALKGATVRLRLNDMNDADVAQVNRPFEAMNERSKKIVDATAQALPQDEVCNVLNTHAPPPFRGQCAEGGSCYEHLAGSTQAEKRRRVFSLLWCLFSPQMFRSDTVSDEDRLAIVKFLCEHDPSPNEETEADGEEQTEADGKEETEEDAEEKPAQVSVRTSPRKTKKAASHGVRHTTPPKPQPQMNGADRFRRKF